MKQLIGNFSSCKRVARKHKKSCGLHASEKMKKKSGCEIQTYKCK
jgi:hypothetical protein